MEICRALSAGDANEATGWGLFTKAILKFWGQYLCGLVTRELNGQRSGDTRIKKKLTGEK